MTILVQGNPNEVNDDVGNIMMITMTRQILKYDGSRYGGKLNCRRHEVI